MRLQRYSSEPALKNPKQFFGDFIRGFAPAQNIARELAWRDVKAQYRQAILGFAWIFIIPLANTLVWLLISRSGIFSTEGSAIPYALYVFSGSILWSIFVDSVSMPINQIISSKSMLTKINFPREAIVLSGIYQVALNAVIKLIILLVIVSVLSGYSPAFGLFLFFIGSFTLVVAGTVVGLLLAPIAMLYSDVEKSLPFLLQFVMFLTPVVFLLPNGVLEGSLFEYNPLSYFIVALRQLLFSMEPSQVDVWLYWFGVSCVALLFFFVIFRISLSVLIERIGN